MKLSVLIPMYNVADYIEKCLSSLLSQRIDEQDYEIIIVNDGSTDNSLEIAESISNKHKNITIYSQENKGAIFTRNKMLKLAKGDYLYFVDADDYVVCNSLAPVLDFAVSNKMDIVGFDTLVTRSREKNKLDDFTDTNALPKIVTGIEYLKENKNLRVEIWWYFIKKDFLNKHHITFDSINYDGDVTFTLRLFLKAKKVAHFSLKIYRYLQSSESTMRSDAIKANKRIINYFMALIVDFTNLIDEVKKKEISFKNPILSNFKFRRDVFAFFTITKMIKANLSIKEFKFNLSQLERINVYPIKNFNDEEFNSSRYKIMLRLMNYKPILFIIHLIYNALPKKIKK